MLANEILNDGFRAKYFELITPTEPIKQRPIPPNRSNNKTNSTNKYEKFHSSQTNNGPKNAVGFNYNANAHRQPRRKKFRKI